MTAEIFVLGLAVAFTALFGWSFRVLPREEWQIIASVPKGRSAPGEWQGLNLTYYGFFTATAAVLAAAMLFILLGAIHVPSAAISALVAAVVILCLPATRLVARVVEKKPNTSTVGGAFFVGTLAIPWLISSIDATVCPMLNTHLPVIPVLAAGTASYAYGEGMGRLACISFGCCYGKDVALTNPRLRRVFERLSFTFTGGTKKVAYEGRLEGVRVVPIQAITAVISIAVALLGTYLFLKASYAISLLVTITGTQVWRCVSEVWRADYRGSGRLSVYRTMAVLIIVYVVGVIVWTPLEVTPPAQLVAGVQALWNPVLLLLLEVLWVVIFLYTGCSMVTAATLSFYVRRDRI